MISSKKRIAMLIFGLIIISICVGMLRVLNLGVDPFVALTIGLNYALNIGFGTLMMILNGIMFLIMLAKKKQLVGIGTIVGALGIGYIIDIVYYHFFISLIISELHLLLRLIILLTTLITLSFGAALTIVANLGILPYDAIGIIIEDITKGKIKFKWARVALDTICAITAFILGSTLGIATIITVFMLGPFINFFRNKINKVALR